MLRIELKLGLDCRGYPIADVTAPKLPPTAWV
jgi:hypothetical protein